MLRISFKNSAVVPVALEEITETRWELLLVLGGESGGGFGLLWLGAAMTLEMLGEKQVLGNEFEFFFGFNFSCCSLVQPRCIVQVQSGSRKQRMACSEPLMRTEVTFNVLYHKYFVYFSSLMAFRLVIGIKHCELK